jgi:hypothetical protein
MCHRATSDLIDAPSGTWTTSVSSIAVWRLRRVSTRRLADEQRERGLRARAARIAERVDVMTTSSDPGVHADERAPLRLRMSQQPRPDRLDGGWWPQSRDLAVELPDLVANFPTQLGPIMRAVYSPPDWDTDEQRVPLASGYLEVAPFPQGNTHVIELHRRSEDRLRLLVVPPGMTESQGDEALLAAATVGYPHSPAELLSHVVDQPEVDPDGQWHDQGGSWWDEGDGPPSQRPGA